jgi:predicted acyl esterase
VGFLDPAGRFLGLPPAHARASVSRGVPVRMRDGIILRTDHYTPRPVGRPTGAAGRPLDDAPTVLVRTPYGRGVPTNWLARAIAERGFHVVVQSCRGTADSGGVFEPMLDERADGLDTVDWINRQPWYDGRLFTFGPSYVGFVQWAVADALGDQLKGLATIVTAADFGRPTYAGGAFSLDTVLTWAALLAAQRGPRGAALKELLLGQPRLREGLAHLPLAEADRVAIGEEVGFFQHWLTQEGPAAGYWTERGHSTRITQVKAPVLMIGGWYDIFLPWQLQDYAALREAGARPYLTIGPWTHGSMALFRHSAAESVAFFRSPDHLRAERVRVQLGGAGVWRAFPDWPPPGAEPRRWRLRPGGALDLDVEAGDVNAGDVQAGEVQAGGVQAGGVQAGGVQAGGVQAGGVQAGGVEAGSGPTGAPADGELAAFTYDPADPTPTLGGPRLIAKVAGVRDNREHETRADVVTFTSAPLGRAVDAVGPVTATLRVRADRPYFDVFVRLCDVDPDGHSWNVCDGLTRVTGGRPAAAHAAGDQAAGDQAAGDQAAGDQAAGDQAAGDQAAEDHTAEDSATDEHRAAEAVDVRVELWPTAYRFRTGHRIRVQVSGGAHPRFARNPGTGAALAGPTDLVPVHRAILSPSSITFTVV